MATSNFGTPKYNLPLVADGLGGDDNNEYEMDALYEYRKDDVDEFNKDTKYFEIIITPGYYEGWCYDVKNLQDYWDYDNIDELTDDDAEYFYGDDAATVKAEMTKELAEIKEKIMSFVDDGAVCLERVATFSNGETIYRAV